MLAYVASLRESHSEEESSFVCMITPNRGLCLYRFGCELLSFAAYTGAVYAVSAAAATVAATAATAAAAAVSAAAAAAASATASASTSAVCLECLAGIYASAVACV